MEQRAFVAGLPADDVVRLAAKLAALFPAGRPGPVGLGDGTGPLVEEEGLAFTVGLHAHVDRRDRGVAEVGRAAGLGVPRADALDEVIPERRVSLSPPASNFAVWCECRPPCWRCGSAEPGAPELALGNHVVSIGREHDRAGVAADHFFDGRVVGHRRGDEDLASLIVVRPPPSRRPARRGHRTRGRDRHRQPPGVGSRTPIAMIRWVSWWTKRSVYIPPPKSQ